MCLDASDLMYIQLFMLFTKNEFAHYKSQGAGDRQLPDQDG